MALLTTTHTRLSFIILPWDPRYLSCRLKLPLFRSRIELEVSRHPPMNTRYICLALYNSPCEPPGKGVGRTKVTINCPLANEERNLYPEFSLLKLCTRFSTEESEGQKNDYYRLYAQCNFNPSSWGNILVEARLHVYDYYWRGRVMLHIGTYSLHLSQIIAMGYIRQYRIPRQARGTDECSLGCEHAHPPPHHVYIADTFQPQTAAGSMISL